MERGLKPRDTQGERSLPLFGQPSLLLLFALFELNPYLFSGPPAGGSRVVEQLLRTPGLWGRRSCSGMGVRLQMV